MFLKVGNEVGWLGYPAIAGSSQLCFFGGKISAFMGDQQAYLVDGVAINGVSGGPAFYNGGEKVVLMGVLSAYIPNRSTGEALPGLAVARDVSHFHDRLKHFKSLEEAKEEKASAELESPSPLEETVETRQRT